MNIFWSPLLGTTAGGLSKLIAAYHYRQQDADVQILKADTLVKVVIGPVVAVGDGFTPVTTLALTTADEAEVLKHDAAAVTDISGNTFAAITGADGYYNLTITAAQLDTEGMLSICINDDSLCLPVKKDFMVVSANVFDSLYAPAATDYLQTDATQISGDATAADNMESAFDGTGSILTLTQLNITTSGADANIILNGSGSGDGLAWGRSGSGDPFGANFEAQINAACDTAISDAALATAAVLGTPAGASVAADIAAVKDETALIVADTGELQTDWANGGRLDLILDSVLAMLDDARAEPGQGAPPVNADAMTKLDYLYKAWRNKTLQSATEYKLYDDAGTTIDHKATVSDDGTDFTRGEVGTGA